MRVLDPDGREFHAASGRLKHKLSTRSGMDLMSIALNVRT
jgi:hypothetical protein